MAGPWEKYQPPKHEEGPWSKFQTKGETTSALDAARIGIERGATLGARPFVAGLGAGAGAFMGNLDVSRQKTGFGRVMESIGAAKDAFSDARQEAILEQQKAAQDQPGASLVGEIGGGLLTAPLLPLKAIKGGGLLKSGLEASKQGAKIGAIAGTGQAIGESDSITDAAVKIAGGAALGGFTGAGFVGAEKGIKAIAKTKPIQAIAKAKDNIGSKVAHALTGIPEKDIQTYAKQTDQINKMIKKFAGDSSLAADEIRQEAQQKIKDTVGGLNQVIEKTIESTKTAPLKHKISVDKVVQTLEAAKAKLDPLVNTDMAAARQIDMMLAQVRQLAVPSGKHVGRTNPYYMHRAKQELQKWAEPSYDAGGNAIFQGGPKAATAAKNAARVARELVEGAAPKAYKEANAKLATLHRLEDKMNRNLLRPDKPEAALVAAGAGTNLRNQRYIEEAGKLIGYPLKEKAEQLAAMRSFSNAPILPVDATGKSLSRMAGGAMAGLAGTAIAGPMVGLPVAAMTSPAALKAAINAGNVPKKIIQKIAGGAKKLDDTAIARAFMRIKEEMQKTQFGPYSPATQILQRRDTQAAPMISQTQDRLPAQRRR